MKKPLTIFDLLEIDENKNKASLPLESGYFSKNEELHDEEKESIIASSFNYFEESRLNGDDYFMEEPEIDDKSNIEQLKEKESNNINNSTYNESDFIKIAKLGKGSYGQAFKIKHKETNKIYALKEINKSKLIKENKYFQIKIENDMLDLCSHPNIVKYYGFYENQTDFAIIEEYCPFGDLSSFILENKQNLNISEIQFIIGQILICLEYLSTKNIIHRDIKPENFLITNNFKLKLIDFGTSIFLGKIFDIETNKFIDDNLKNTKIPSESFMISNKLYEDQQPVMNNELHSSFKYNISDIQLLKYPFAEIEKNNSKNKFEDIKCQKFVGTAEYMAPEIINSKKIGYYTDIWSMACILYLCFMGHTPFTDKTDYLIFQNIIHCKYCENNINLIPEEALDLIKKVFRTEPSERIGYKGEKEFDYNIIKSHPFFTLKDEKLDLIHIKQHLMNKCSYYKKYLERNNKIKEKRIDKHNNLENNKEEIDNKEDYFNNEENYDENGRILKTGLLKKRSPYYYYDLRKVILYDTPRIDYIDPEKEILKGTITLTKKCSAELIKRNQFQLITPQRTFIFMCKDRYDISPWVSAINNAIQKYSS